MESHQLGDAKLTQQDQEVSQEQHDHHELFGDNPDQMEEDEEDDDMRDELESGLLRQDKSSDQSYHTAAQYSNEIDEDQPVIQQEESAPENN